VRIDQFGYAGKAVRSRHLRVGQGRALDRGITDVAAVEDHNRSAARVLERVMPKIATPEDQRTILASGIGRVELELINSFNVPLFWSVPKDNGTEGYRNATAFFLNAGQSVFGVTASHVIDGWKRSCIEQGAGCLYLSGHREHLPIDWSARIIDDDADLDIATFAVTEDEVRLLGKNTLTGAQKIWPPRPPTKNCILYYCGFPGVGTRLHPRGGPLFGAVPGMGIATSVSEKSISIQLEREHLVPLLAGGVPPENFNFGGISGGPVIKIVETFIRTYALAGIIYQGPNTSSDSNEAISGFELISARHAHFILPDGRLDKRHWASLNL
jgi:hypothetical protein